MTNTNTVTITQAAAVLSGTISASPTNLSADGGTVTITGTSNFPAGSTLYVFVNGLNNGTTLVGSNGAISLMIGFSQNYDTTPNTFQIDLSTNSNNT